MKRRSKGNLSRGRWGFSRAALVAVPFFLAFFLLGSSDVSVAVNYDAKIQESQTEQKKYEKKSAELAKDLEEIDQAKKDSLAYIEKLDKKTEKVEKEQEELQSRIKQTQTSLSDAEEELSAAEEEKQRQYTTMKQRIKYMYENGNQDYLELLFSSDSVAELLNRTEYIEKISSYDKKIFRRFEKLCTRVARKKQEIDETLTSLQEMKQDADAQKEALKELKKKKKDEIRQYNNSMKKKQSKANAYAKKAAQAEAEVERLLEEKQREIDQKNDMGSGNSGSTKLRWPLNVSGRLSSGFGPRKSPTAGASSYHKGQDIAVPIGTPIVAAGSGTVVTATYSSSAGNYIMISHGNKLYTVYMHCSRLAVSAGDTVTSGQIIAYAGSTGISTGSHLHFSVIKNGTYVDPLIYVKQP